MPLCDPNEFLQLAQLIGVASGPYPAARHRSAVSRAYYSVFLAARDRLQSVFGVLPERHRHAAHDKVWKAFGRSEVTALRAVGRTLKDLKEMREESDYDLSADVGADAASEAIALAKQLALDVAAADVSRCLDPKTV